MAESLIDRLRAEWRADLKGAPCSDSARDRAFDELVSCYHEGRRHYHTLEHVASVHRWVDALAADEDPGPIDHLAVRLAAWYHDVIHDPGAADNETRSAVIAAVVLGSLGVPAETVAECTRLIELTSVHEVADGDSNGAVLVDADLAILAASPERYDRYRRAVREEYEHLPEEVFRQGRTALLQHFLGRPHVFWTQSFRTEREPMARANLARELQELTGSG